MPRKEIVDFVARLAALKKSVPAFQHPYPMDAASKAVRGKVLFPREGYHGTRSDFSEFGRGDIGYHFGTPEQANNRLRLTRGYAGLDDAERVIPARLALHNPLLMDDVGEWSDPAAVALALARHPKFVDQQPLLNSLRQEAKDLSRQFESRQEYYDSPEVAEFFDELRGIIRSQGYDGVKYTNKVENAFGDTADLTPRATRLLSTARDRLDSAYQDISARRAAGQLPTEAELERLRSLNARQDRIRAAGRGDPHSYIVFDPSQARVRFADFNPDKLDSGDLGAAIAGASLIPALMPTEAEAAPYDVPVSQDAIDRALILNQDAYTPRVRSAGGLSPLSEMALRERMERAQSAAAYREAADPRVGFGSMRESDIPLVAGTALGAAAPIRAMAMPRAVNALSNLARLLGRDHPNLWKSPSLPPDIESAQAAADESQAGMNWAKEQLGFAEGGAVNLAEGGSPDPYPNPWWRGLPAPIQQLSSADVMPVSTLPARIDGGTSPSAATIGGITGAAAGALPSLTNATIGKIAGTLATPLVAIPGLGLLGTAIGTAKDVSDADDALASLGFDPNVSYLSALNAGLFGGLFGGRTAAEQAKEAVGPIAPGDDETERRLADLGINLSVDQTRAGPSLAGLQAMGSPGLEGYGNLATPHSYGFVDGNLIGNWSGVPSIDLATAQSLAQTQADIDASRAGYKSDAEAMADPSLAPTDTPAPDPGLGFGDIGDGGGLWQRGGQVSFDDGGQVRGGPEQDPQVDFANGGVMDSEISPEFMDAYASERERGERALERGYVSDAEEMERAQPRRIPANRFAGLSGNLRDEFIRQYGYDPRLPTLEESLARAAEDAAALSGLAGDASFKMIVPQDATDAGIMLASSAFGPPGVALGRLGRLGLAGTGAAMAGMAPSEAEAGKRRTIETALGKFPTSTIGRIINRTKERGGYSVNLATGEVPETGLMVGRYRNDDPRNTVMSGPLTRLAAERHAAVNRAALRRPDQYYGTWRDPDDSQLYLDVSRRFDPEDVRAASKFGESTKQKAYYDKTLGKSIPIGSLEDFLASPEYARRQTELAEQGYDYMRRLNQSPEWWPMKGTPLEEVYGADALPRLAGAIATTAPNTAPLKNMQQASEYMRRLINEEPIVQPGWRTPEGLLSSKPGKMMPLEKSRRLNLLRTERGALDELSREKVNREGRALMGDPNAVVVDRWHIRTAEDPSKNVYVASDEGVIGSPKNYLMLEDAITKIAKSQGLDPSVFSAMSWTGARERARNTGDLFGVPYRPGSIPAESYGYAAHITDLIRAKAEQLGTSPEKVMKALRAGHIRLLAEGGAVSDNAPEDGPALQPLPL